MVRALINKIKLPDYTVFIIYSIIIGAAVGLSVVLFHKSIEFFNELFFKRTVDNLFFFGAAAVIALPSIGMLIQSIMILSFPETARKRGVAEVIKNVAVKGGRISFRTTLFHFLAPVICIGSGGTVGPEAPAAQLGGGIANKLAFLFDLSDSRKRVFTAAGAGAAIAAIFNTPLGGIFFALEVVLLNDFQTTTFSALILSSVTASAISRIFLGNRSVFTFHSPEVGPYNIFYLYALIGIIAGFISLLFIRYSNSMDDLFHKKILKAFPQWLVMVLVGLLVGLAGFFYNDIFGIGYNGINHLLSNSFTWQVVAVLFILKFLLVPLILNSGGFGGVFAPSLFMGACFGWLSAWILNTFLGFNVDPTSFILISMGAMLGGINSIPISSILMIFEMTRDYSFILPLMLAVVSSTMIVQIVLKRSTHERHLEKQGYRLARKGDVSLLRKISVSQVMINDAVLIPEETSLPKVINRLMESPHNTFYTVDRNGMLAGTISESELRPIITEYESLKDVLVARDIAKGGVTTVLEGDDLDYVMNLFESKDSEEFPVVDNSVRKTVIGTVRRQDVISAYNKENLKQDIAESFSRELKSISQTKTTRIIEGYLIAERKAPGEFIGKSLIELKLRNIFGTQVLLVRQTRGFYDVSGEEYNVLVPDGGYIIQEHDVLILLVPEDKIELIDNWNK